jgi:hypothetical protein
MSDTVRALVWQFYQGQRFGAPRILAIALSDESDDRGGGIFQSVNGLAAKTEQTRRAVQRQLRRLEEVGLLQCVEKSPGGPGQFHQYRLNLSLLVSAGNGDSGSLLTATQGRCLLPPNGDLGSLLSDAPIYRTTKVNVGDVSTVAVQDDVEDQRLAAWMLQRIRVINPRYREPHWATWRKELDRLRRLDKRGRREIAELFAWANAHAFWQTNVLSPAALRRQWDRLETARLKEGGSVHASGRSDGRCVREKGGAKCGAQAVFRTGDGRDLCRQCQGEDERERSVAQA